MRRHAVLAIAAWTLVLGAPDAAARGREFAVTLADAPPYFRPDHLQIQVGDSVVWRNSGPVLVHALTDQDAQLLVADVSVGGEVRHTFKRAGVYRFVCYRHHFMRGSVLVRDASGSLEPTPEFPYQRAFTEYPVPTPKAVPRMVIASRVDDSVWFTEGGGDFYGFEDIPPQNKIGRLDDRGVMVEYATPTPNGDGSGVAVDSLVMDPKGVVWFTERLTNRVGRLDRTGAITEFQLPGRDGQPLGIDLDKDGGIWVAERGAGRITRMTPDGRFTHVDLAVPDSEPRSIYVDSRDRVWFTTRTGNEIGYYDRRAASVTRLKIPTELARPTGICETSDGTVYFVEMVGNKIARVRDGQITEFSLPTRFAAPFKIVADANDVLWFTEVFGNAIGRFDPRTGSIVEYKIPTPDSRPGGIAVDRRGRIWFTEQLGNKIGVLDPKQLPQQSPVTAPEERIQSFTVPTPGAGPGNDLIESNGWLWFNELHGNKVGAIHLQTRHFRELPLATPASMPAALAVDAGGVLWVAQFRTGSLARIDPATGRVREFPLPDRSALPSDVAVDADGRVWVALLARNAIARFDPSAETFATFAMPRPDSSPLQLALDDDGRVWVSASEERGNYVARFDPVTATFEPYDMPAAASSPIGLLPRGAAVWVAAGGLGRLARLDVRARAWKQFAIPTLGAEPVQLAADRQGRIWMTDGGGLGTAGGNQIVCFDPATERFELMPLSRAAARPRGIVAASDGAIWFTQQHANLISRVEPQENRSWNASNLRSR